MTAINVQLIPVNSIAAPSFVRTSNGHDKESLTQLADSIKSRGLLQPIVVRPISTNEGDEMPQEGLSWVIVAGRRRLAAFKLAGLPEIPALITDTDEASSYELEIAENIQREQMTLADTARAVRTLMTIYNNQKKVCEILSKSPAWVSKHLAVTSSKTPQEIKDLMDRGLVTDLETLMLLKQIAEMPTAHPTAAATLTRMMRIANEGNMNRQIARDALAKLKAPAQQVATTTTAGTQTVTTRRTVDLGAGEQAHVYDPAVEFSVALPIDVIEAFQRLGAPQLVRLLKDEQLLSSIIAEYERQDRASGDGAPSA